MASAVSAADLYCEGNIETIEVGNWNGVYVDGTWNEKPQRFCDIDGTWKNLPAGVCKVWVSTLQTALYTGTSVKVRYDEGDGIPADCASLLGYSNPPAPHSVILLK